MRVSTERLWKIGAAAYVFWGVLHIIVGTVPLVRYAVSGPGSMLAFHEFEVEAASGPLVHASHLIAEHSTNLVAFGLLAIIVAVTLVARGRPLGFWINALVLGIVDISFVLAEITTGHLAVMPAGIGPVLYLAALAVTAVALARNGGEADRRAGSSLGAREARRKTAAA